MSHIFLHGGGDDPTQRQATFGRFVQLLPQAGTASLALVVAEATDADRQASFGDYRAIFEALGVPASQIAPVFVSPQTPLQRHMLETLQPGGVFVCGGATPYYHQSLCGEPGWVRYLAEANIPYGGTSAGAAIASGTAILGGWQALRSTTRPILFQGASEGLDLLTVQPGLGLVPWAVDVHASQWGTLLRLVHAVELGLVSAGWAIDENTALIVREGETRVVGSGHAYCVVPGSARAVSVTMHTVDQG
ncbi:MAG: Type 1 glutamine amidotransferase-like domain-containing protein [Chloroflexaceae bacterium]|jgi:cyanophycinase|nr:Type 1 glutamine amidotransferase-like domain-containing protein [Chloroflexaceae bacterium]